MSSPKLYATLLLWLLAELFERLPEVGDPEKPRLVFFFDEAHLLFADAPKALLEKIEQVVRLIRSKGVGVYFVTQNPLDIPDAVLGQLGNRVQHALRAFTPRDQKAVKSRGGDDAAESRVLGRASHHGARCRRGARVAARREGPARRHRARVDRAAGQSARADCATRSERGSSRRRRSRASTRRAVDRESAYEKLKGRAEGADAGAALAVVAARRAAGAPRIGAATGATRRWRQSRLRHLVRAARPARRAPNAGAHRSDGQERRALGRLASRTRADPRRARLAARRPALRRRVRWSSGVPLACQRDNWWRRRDSCSISFETGWTMPSSGSPSSRSGACYPDPMRSES